MCRPDAEHPPRTSTRLFSITSLITAAICADTSIRTDPEQRLSNPTACNPTQGHETLTSDPSCDASGGGGVPQVCSKRLWRVGAGAAEALLTFVFVFQVKIDSQLLVMTRLTRFQVVWKSEGRLIVSFCMKCNTDLFYSAKITS